MDTLEVLQIGYSTNESYNEINSSKKDKLRAKNSELFLCAIYYVI
jgi:hypothetical protein